MTHKRNLRGGGKGGDEGGVTLSGGEGGVIPQGLCIDAQAHIYTTAAQCPENATVQFYTSTCFFCLCVKKQGSSPHSVMTYADVC